MNPVWSNTDSGSKRGVQCIDIITVYLAFITETYFKVIFESFKICGFIRNSRESNKGNDAKIRVQYRIIKKIIIIYYFKIFCIVFVNIFLSTGFFIIYSFDIPGIMVLKLIEEKI